MNENPYEPTDHVSNRCDCNRVTWVDARIIFFIFGLGFCSGMLFCGYLF